MEQTAGDRVRRLRKGWGRWLGLGLGGLLLGGVLGAHSVVALLARVEQLEREAAESEARVAELQVLRDGLSRRLRLMEQQLTDAPASARQAQAKKGPVLAR